MNEINLSAFQFEYDLTWMSFFQNAKGQTYTRYGGRDDSDSESHLTQKSLKKTMERVLELHAKGLVKPWSKYEPHGEKWFTPEQMPILKKAMSKRKESCIHCHDIKNTMLRELHAKGSLTKYGLFTYPSPKRLGIEVSRDEQTAIRAVVEDSVAAKAGVKRGDRLLTANGQRVLTYADFTRVLELTPTPGKLTLKVQRDGKDESLQLKLGPDWRRSPDPSWRASTGIVGPGAGFWANPIGDGQRKQLGIKKQAMAMKVVVVWAAWAKRAGVKNGDIVVEVDGLKTNSTMRQIHAKLQLGREWGETIQVNVIRKGKPMELTMTLPKSPPGE